VAKRQLSATLQKGTGLKTRHYKTRPPQKAAATKLAVGVVDFDRDGLDFGALLLPAEDGFADTVHCTLSDGAGALGTFVDDFEDAGGVLLVFDAAFADGSDPFDEVFGHGGFALDAAYARGSAAGGPIRLE
jgi:hypothetical protein